MIYNPSAMENKKRVLVVDDEPAILRFVSTSLGLAGFDVITTSSGEEAINLVKSQNLDIMLIDVFMQPMTGFDVLQQLRTFSKIPIIVFTARKEIGEQAIKEGANGYIAKPFMPADLIKKIQDILGIKAA